MGFAPCLALVILLVANIFVKTNKARHTNKLDSFTLHINDQSTYLYSLWVVYPLQPVLFGRRHVSAAATGAPTVWKVSSYFVDSRLVIDVNFASTVIAQLIQQLHMHTTCANANK